MNLKYLKYAPFVLLPVAVLCYSPRRVATPRRLLPQGPQPTASASATPTVPNDPAQKLARRPPPPAKNGKPAAGGYRYDGAGPGYASEARLPPTPKLPEGVREMTHRNGPNSQIVEVTMQNGKHIRLTTVKEHSEGGQDRKKAEQDMMKPAKHFVETW